MSFQLKLRKFIFPLWRESFLLYERFSYQWREDTTIVDKSFGVAWNKQEQSEHKSRSSLKIAICWMRRPSFLWTSFREKISERGKRKTSLEIAFIKNPNLSTFFLSQFHCWRRKELARGNFNRNNKKWALILKYLSDEASKTRARLPFVITWGAGMS